MTEEEQEEGALTLGWCQAIVKGSQGKNESYLQVLSVNRSAPLLKLLLHDGRDCMEVAVSTQAKKQAENLQQGSVIQADTKNYSCTTMAGNRLALFKGIVIIQSECELLPPANENAPAPYFGVNKLNQDLNANPAPMKAAPSPLFGNHKKPAKASPFMRNPVRKKITGGASGENFLPINNLNPFINNFKIKGRCTEKEDMRTWDNAKGKGTLFNFTLMDESGEIRCTAFKEEATKYFNEVVEGQVYTLSKGRVKNDNYTKKMALTLNRNSVLKIVQGEKDNFAKKQYDFKSFADISKMDVPEEGPKVRVDVCCIVKSVGDRDQFVAKSSKNYVKRELICCDNTGIEMSATLWGSHADEFTKESCPAGTCIILPQASVSTFGGRSISVKKLIHGDKINEYDVAMNLKHWWETEGVNTETFKSVQAPIRKKYYTTFKEARDAKKGVPPEGITEDERKQYKGEWITVSGIVPFIKVDPEREPWYKSQPNGAKKVELNENSGKWVDKDNTAHDTYDCRWLLRLKFADYTQAEWCSAFDKAAREITGIGAKEMEETYKNSFEEAEKFFRDRQFTEWEASMMMKEEFYNDAYSMKFRINSVKELDYVEDTKRMMKDIGNF